MKRCPAWLVLVSTLALLGGCAADQQQAKAPHQPRRVSPAPVAPPTMPPGTFDQAAAQTELAAAVAARQAGDPQRARQAAETALDHWPADSGAWSELEKDCQTLKDDACVRYAAFFRAKVEFVSTLPPRAASLGFQNIAQAGASEEEEGEGEGAGAAPVGSQPVGGQPAYDQQTIDMARRLWAFYHLEDHERQAPRG